MATLSLVIFVAALLTTSAASTDGDKATVWGSVVVLNNGERTPLNGFPSPVLTPQGAVQMRLQGAAFRKRYLTGPVSTSSSSENITEYRPIKDLERDAINNAQLSITSLTDDYIVGGAAAFMQGLYPPNRDALLTSHGGQDLALNTLQDKNVSYPLGGYQYPAIETMTVFDERGTVLQGHVGCNMWLKTLPAVEEDSVMQAYEASSQATYDLLFSQSTFNGTFPDYKINFFYAYELWDYVQYEQIHNKTVHQGLEQMTSATAILNTLEDNARRWQQAMNTNARVSGLTFDSPIRTIGGRTLAQGILDNLRAIVDTQGEADKLSVMFTSFPPILAFFALSGLRNSETNENDDFFGLPEPGAAMAFELIGDQPGAYGVFPEPEHLWVRFAWRKNTDPTTSFRAVSLFRGSKNQYDLPYITFRNRMLDFAADVTTWCNMCGADQMAYCRARSLSNGGTDASLDGGSGSQTGGVHNPVVAGAIGAIVTLAVVGLASAAAAVFGGVRMYRRSKDESENGSKRGLGGFKGAEKMASDADVTLGRGGVRHERVGSWELRSGDGPGAAPGGDPTGAPRHADDVEPGRLGAGLSFSSTSATPRLRSVVDDDGVSALSVDIEAAPVRPRESI